MQLPSILKGLFRSKRPTQARSRAKVFRPSLELLEDRAVPTIFYQPVLGAETAVDNGGNKLSDPGVYLTFHNDANFSWGDVGSQQLGAAGTATVNATNNLFNSSYFPGL